MPKHTNHASPSWPQELAPNIFSIGKSDPDQRPDRIHPSQWNGVFKAGRSLTIDALTADGKRITLAAITLRPDESAAAAQAHLEQVPARWKRKGIAKDWKDLVETARVEIREYYVEELAEYGLRLAD